jgi:gas vesicle protein
MAQISVKQAAGYFLGGAMVGAAVALLYAPQSGAQTTRNVKKFAKDSVNQLDELQENIRDQVSDWVNDVSEVVQDGVERGKKLTTQGYEKVLQGFDDTKKCVEDGKNMVEKLIKSA